MNKSNMSLDELEKIKIKDLELLNKFSTTFKNKNKVDTDKICRDIRGKE